MENFIIRKACIENAPRMAEIHVFGWRCAYKDFIPMDFLINKHTVNKREEKFREYLSGNNDYGETYVFEENNIIKAFMTIGNCRDEDKNNKTFELQGIYVDPLFQRQKTGTHLVEYCIKEARIKDKNEIVLWVFEKNYETIKFYKKKGFEKDGKSKLSEYFNENIIRMSMKLK